MDFSDIILSFTSNFFKIKNLQKRWEATKNLGKSDSLEIPKELIGLNIDLLSRSFYNINSIQPNLDWVWPYWVEQQYNPESNSFLPSSYLSINLTHRNWTAFSSLDSDFEAIVDPRGLLTPLFDSWSVDFWILKSNYVILPSKLPDVEQYLENSSPIIKSLFYKKDLKVTSEYLMHSYNKNNYVVVNYLIERLDINIKNVSFFISIRPYNPESVVPIFSIEYIERINAFKINNKDYLYLKDKPSRVICFNQSEGDVFYVVRKKNKDKLSAKDKSGLCTAFAEFKFNFSKNKNFSTQIIIPTENKNIKNLFNIKFNDLKNINIRLWENKTKNSLFIKTPDSKLNEAFSNSKTNLLVLLDKTEIPPGPFTYHKMWFRDSAYSISALLKLGFYKEVKNILKHYFDYQKKDGYFQSQNGEWDSNGQALWTIAQYYFFTKDKSFIEKYYDKLEKACKWIFKNTDKTKKNKKDLHYGLLPPGFSAEHFGPADYYYWDNFWGYAGVRDFIKVSKKIGKNIKFLEMKNNEYLKNILTSIKNFQSNVGEKYIPSSPYRRKDSSIIGSVCAVYPLQILNPEKKDFMNTLKIIHKKYMSRGGFFHRLMHSGLNIYLTAQVAESYLMQKSYYAIKILNWIIDNATDTFTFPEAIHPETKGGCMGDGHHGWATSELIHLIRNILFYEKNKKLIFFPVIPNHWLDTGNRLEVKNAYSHFGKFDFSLVSTDEYLLFTFESKIIHSQPEKIEINLPINIEKVEINGKLKYINSNTFDFNFKDSIVIKIYR